MLLVRGMSVLHQWRYVQEEPHTANPAIYHRNTTQFAFPLEQVQVAEPSVSAQPTIPTAAPSQQQSSGGAGIAAAAALAGVVAFAGAQLFAAGPSLATLEEMAVPLDVALNNGKPTVMEFYANWCAFPSMLACVCLARAGAGVLGRWLWCLLPAPCSSARHSCCAYSRPSCTHQWQAKPRAEQHLTRHPLVLPCAHYTVTMSHACEYNTHTHRCEVCKEVAKYEVEVEQKYGDK